MSDIEIIHADRHILVVNKPSGLLSVPGIGPEKADCLIARLRRQFSTARIVHRLDRDTSGLLVLALDADTHRELSRQFHDREVRKHYQAVVAGHPNASEGTIDLPMRKDLDPARKPRHIVDHERGRHAITGWSVLEYTNWSDSGGGLRDVARVELRPVTGRSHQLRLHLLSIGHPILGDDLYAPPDILALSSRLLLHAERLCITDPYTAAPLEFHAPCPF